MNNKYSLFYNAICTGYISNPVTNLKQWCRRPGCARHRAKKFSDTLRISLPGKSGDDINEIFNLFLKIFIFMRFNNQVASMLLLG